MFKSTLEVYLENQRRYLEETRDVRIDTFENICDWYSFFLERFDEERNNRIWINVDEENLYNFLDEYERIFNFYFPKNSNKSKGSFALLNIFLYYPYLELSLNSLNLKVFEQNPFLAKEAELNGIEYLITRANAFKKVHIICGEIIKNEIHVKGEHTSPILH